jgi:hypothetical protein
MARLNCKVINGKIYSYHKVVVHTFLLSDVEDPEIYAAGPIWDWQQTEAGKFVIANAEEKPVFHSQPDYNSYGYKFAITAVLEEKILTEYYLKFGKPVHKIIS